jgi:DNA-binding MarR family transcriptional regulator
MSLTIILLAMTEDLWYHDLPVPALLRMARGSYGDAVRAALASAGFDDLPRNGAFVLVSLLETQLSLTQIVDDLSVTKQAASLLLDTLVLRGYLERGTDPTDRRRMVVSLTARGRATAEVVDKAVGAIDADLERRVTPAQLAGLRAGLAALGEIRAAGRAH